MTEPLDARLAADSRGNFPKDGLRYLLIGYGEESDEQFFDCEGPLEFGMDQMRRWGLSPERGRGELAETLALDLSDESLARRTTRMSTPAGGSTREFLRYLLTRVDLELAHPSPLDADLGMIDRQDEPMAHLGGFFEEGIIEECHDGVMLANEDRVKAWLDDQAGVSRLWLAADLGRPIGVVEPQLRLAQLQRGEPEPDPIETSTCVIVLRMDHSIGLPVVEGGYPELPHDPEVPRRWPELVALFGGFFHQETLRHHGSFWRAERAFHDLSSPEVVAGVTAALDRLLAQGQTHAELCRTLHSLGSCVLPDDAVRWVTGLGRRMTELDWHAEPGPPADAGP
jgi:hypothetical protein